MSIEDLLEESLKELEDKSPEKRQITIELVARYLFDACGSPGSGSTQAVNYITDRIVNGHHYKGNVQFEKVIKQYHQTRSGLETSAEKLVDMVDGYDKWLIG